jgi:hypothetical protein
MQIQVLKKSDNFTRDVQQEDKVVTLLFKKSNIRYQGRKTPIVSIYDENNEYLPCSLKLTQYQSRVPSSLLAKWINANCAEKLLTLKDRCCTVEKVKDGVQTNKYYFTNKEDALFGLHKVKVKSDGVTYRVVSIDSSIGMQAVEKIINTLGIDIESEYDKVSNKMIKINLKGV